MKISALFQRIINHQPATVSGTITTNASHVDAACAGYATAIISISGTYAGVNFTFQVSEDNGATWTNFNVIRVGGSITQETSSGVLTANTTRQWRVALAGYTNVRAQATAYTSGTANIRINLSAAAHDDMSVVSVQNTTLAVTQSGSWTDTVTNGKTIKTAPFNVRAAGDNQIVVGVASKRIKVIAYVIQGYGGAEDFQWTDSSGTPVILQETMQIQPFQVIAESIAADGFLFATTAGKDLVLSLGSGVQVTGRVTYFDNDAT